MFGRFLQTLLAPTPAPLSADEAHLALAALLVRVARADGVYGAAEMRRIDLVLSADFRLSPFEAASLRAQAEVLEAEAPDTVRFTRALKDAVALDERGRLVEALWSVAGEDGGLAAEEDSQIRLIASLLGINDRDRALARRRAEQK